MKAIIKETGQAVEVVSRFMPKKRNVPSRDWMCNLSNGTCINESELEYISDNIEGNRQRAEGSVPKDLEEHASSAGFDYVDNIVQEHPGHRFNDHDVEYAYRDAFIAGAKWQKQHDAELIEIAYNDGITIGMTKQKEQMMKEARNHFVLRVLSDNTIKKMIELYNDEVDCKFGDRVRIIIIKEEKNGTE